MCETRCYLSLCLWFISRHTLSFKFIHIMAKDEIFFSYWLNNIPLCMCISDIGTDFKWLSLPPDILKLIMEVISVLIYLIMIITIIYIHLSSQLLCLEYVQFITFKYFKIKLGKQNRTCIRTGLWGCSTTLWLHWFKWRKSRYWLIS